ncbi:MAG: hypothetical protein HY319_06905 [Armatimonadetes bacterium]|nr:hypothetical protein [Armatimonadota bacterium]
MRLFPGILIVFVLALAGPAPGLPGFSDQQVLQAINAGREQAHQVEPEQVRIARPSQMADVTLVGYSKGDGYLLGTVFLGAQSYRPEEAARLWLTGAGWTRTDAAARAALARRWVQEVMLAFGECLIEQDPGRPFGAPNPDFSPVLERADADGGVILVGWIREPSGVLGDIYRRSLFHFGSDGRLVRVRMLDRFQAPLQ